MKPKNYEIMLDIYNGVLTPQKIEFTTDDFGMCMLTFNILENKITPYRLDDCIVRMVINGQQQDCNIVDSNRGKVSITLLQSMLIEGANTAELQVYDSIDQTLRLTTPNFKYNVRKSMMNDSTVEADPNYSILQNMILEVSNADKVANEAIEMANQAIERMNTELVPSVEQAIVDTNEAISNTNVAATNANTKATYAQAKGEYAQEVAEGVDGRLQAIETKNTEQDKAINEKNQIDGVNQPIFNFIGSPVSVEKVAYGLRVDLKTDTFTRLGGALGKTNVNDFINIPPFNGKLEIVEGQHMKKIPLFYYKRVPIELEDIPKSADNNEMGKQLVVWEDWISCYPFEDMYVHPMFIRNGKVFPYVYFSQYEGSIYDTSANTYLLNDEQVADFNNDLLCSIPNAKPASGLTQNLTIEMARKLAENRNANSKYTWFQQVFTTVSGIQLLIAIACGGYDCQTSIGRGVVDLESGSGNESLKTGSTQSMGLYCGNSGVDGKSSVNFFGIENFWGNIWKFVDGFNIEAKTLHQGWVSNDDYTCDTSNNKDNLGFTISKANGYMSRMGYSDDIDFGFIPTETKSGEPISKDYLYQNSTHNGFLITLLGGSWSSGSNAGCFYWYLGNSSADRIRSIASRLICIPRI